jgi:hypothetical protein
LLSTLAGSDRSSTMTTTALVTCRMRHAGHACAWGDKALPHTFCTCRNR